MKSAFLSSVQGSLRQDRSEIGLKSESVEGERTFGIGTIVTLFHWHRKKEEFRVLESRTRTL